MAHTDGSKPSESTCSGINTEQLGTRQVINMDKYCSIFQDEVMPIRRSKIINSYNYSGKISIARSLQNVCEYII